MRRVRPEIQALRALAVGAVVAFHFFPLAVPGGYVGVDVFFVISGYLITAHLLRELEGTGRVLLLAFYGRRIRRLLPAALLVLAVTVVGIVLFVPMTLWREFASEVAASALYVENWLLAANSVDYFAHANAPSPVQHYWSLSVEEQFYLVWPLLLIVASAIAVRLRRAPRRAILVALLTVLAGSLAASIVVTATSPSVAYFSTFSHAWEFALGGLLLWVERGLAARRAARPDAHRGFAALGWLGITTVVVTAFVFTGETPFPGWIALIPALGAAAVIVAGESLTAWSPLGRVVALRPVQWLGDTSYSVYLWHWPLIVLTPFVIGSGLTLPVSLWLLAATLVLAELTRRLVEKPIRESRKLGARPGFSILTAGVAMALVTGAAIVPVTVVDRATAAATQHAAAVIEELEEPQDEPSCIGASALLDEGCDPGHTVDPQLGPEFAKQDGQTTGVDLEGASLDAGQTCEPVGDTAVRECRYGPDDATVKFAIVGDSHAAQYKPLLEDIADEHGWQLLSYVRGACLPTRPGFAIPHSKQWEMRADCQEWKADLTDAVAASEADTIIVAAATPGQVRTDPELLAEIEDAYTDTWTAWAAAGKTIIDLRDTPYLGFPNVPDCIAAAGTVDDPCAVPRDEAVWPDATAEARKHVRGVEVVDPIPAICDATLCHAVVGGVIVFHDEHHLTTTFVQTLRPLVERPLLDALG